MNNPLRFVDPLGYRAQDPQGVEVDRIVVININDAEQQRRLKEQQTAKNWLDLPLIPTGVGHCILGMCGHRLTIRQTAHGIVTAVGNEADRIRHKVKTVMPDGVNLNVTGLYLISVKGTITPDLDIYGGIDIPILSGWTEVIGDATKGGTLTPKSGFGISLTGSYIIDPAVRDNNGEVKLGDPRAREARHSFYAGGSWGVTGCYYACGGLEQSSGRYAMVMGAGTPGVFAGHSQAWYLGRYPLANLPPNPFSFWK
jgi:hypothetical protein